MLLCFKTMIYKTNFASLKAPFLLNFVQFRKKSANRSSKGPLLASKRPPWTILLENMLYTLRYKVHYTLYVTLIGIFLLEKIPANKISARKMNSEDGLEYSNTSLSEIPHLIPYVVKDSANIRIQRCNHINLAGKKYLANRNWWYV